MFFIRDNTSDSCGRGSRLLLEKLVEKTVQGESFLIRELVVLERKKEEFGAARPKTQLQISGGGLRALCIF